MSRKCEICGKGQVSGNAVSHSNRHTRRKWNANIQTVRVAEENGTVRRANVCTRCIRSNKVNRARPAYGVFSCKKTAAAADFAATDA